MNGFPEGMGRKNVGDCAEMWGSVQKNKEYIVCRKYRGRHNHEGAEAIRENVKEYERNTCKLTGIWTKAGKQR